MDKRIIILLAVISIFLLYSKEAKALDINKCDVLDRRGENYKLIVDIINAPVKTCINIIADDVTLDCQAHKIDSDISSGFTNYAIVSNSSNTTIKNCFLTDWSYGIYITNSNNGQIENITASYVDKTMKVSLSCNPITTN